MMRHVIFSLLVVLAATPVFAQEEVDRERALLRKQAEGSGKPEGVIEKMVEGRLRKYYEEVVLSEQSLVMDPDQTVEKAGKAVGARVLAFRRLQLGEQADS